MQEGIKVSICCLTYNHEKFLRSTLDSFVKQKTDFAFEVLIHDDASTDNTQAIIREYEQIYPEIIKPIFQQENQWSQGNTALSQKYNFPRSRGKYIAMCEGDDYWTDFYKLQKQVDFLDSHPGYIMHTQNGLIHFDDGRDPILFNTWEKVQDIGTYDLLTFRKFPTASVLFRSEILPKIYELKEFGDTIIWVLLSLYGKIYYSPEVTSIYNRGNHGVVQGTKRILWVEKMERWNKEMKKIVSSSSIRKSFDYRIFAERNLQEYRALYLCTSWKKDTFIKLKALCGIIKNRLLLITADL